MEPGEHFIRRLLKFVSMILAFVVAFVFGDLSFGMGRFGVVTFAIGLLAGAIAIYLLKGLRS